MQYSRQWSAPVPKADTPACNNINKSIQDKAPVPIFVTPACNNSDYIYA